MPADYTQCRVRKQSNECESEKRLAKSQRSGVALTEYGARGALAGRALPTSTACGRNTVLPSGDCINSFAFTIRSPSQFVRLHGNMHRSFFRAGAGTISIRSPSQFVRLHGNTHRLFFSGWSSNGTAHGRHISLYFYLTPSVGLLLPVRQVFCNTG